MGQSVSHSCADSTRLMALSPNPSLSPSLEIEMEMGVGVSIYMLVMSCRQDRGLKSIRTVAWYFYTI